MIKSIVMYGFNKPAIPSNANHAHEVKSLSLFAYSWAPLMILTYDQVNSSLGKDVMNMDLSLSSLSIFIYYQLLLALSLAVQKYLKSPPDFKDRHLHKC